MTLPTRRFKDLSLTPYEFVVFVEESFRYDTGYGTHDSPDYSTHEELAPIFMKNEDALVHWIRENQSSRDPKAYRVFAIKPVTIETQIHVAITR